MCVRACVRACADNLRASASRAGLASQELRRAAVAAAAARVLGTDGDDDARDDAEAAGELYGMLCYTDLWGELETVSSYDEMLCLYVAAWLRRSEAGTSMSSPLVATRARARCVSDGATVACLRLRWLGRWRCVCVCVSCVSCVCVCVCVCGYVLVFVHAPG